MPKQIIKHLVAIEYENDENDDFSADFMEVNLAEALERERQEGALTHSDISANWVTVDRYIEDAPPAMPNRSPLFTPQELQHIDAALAHSIEDVETFVQSGNAKLVYTGPGEFEEYVSMPDKWASLRRKVLGIENASAPQLETYQTACVSTGHLSQQDRDAFLDALTAEEPMLMSRDTGYFLKLYEEIDYNFEGSLADITPALKSLITHLHAQGIRMVEFDCDGPTLPGFETFGSGDEEPTMPEFNHAYTVAFDLKTPIENGEVPGAVLRAALKARLEALTDAELEEAVGLPFDTYTFADK